MKNKKTIRWAILGAGKIAKAFATDFQYLQNATLVAIGSRDFEKGQAFANEFNIPRVLNYEELMEDATIDAVYIATPHNFHYEQARQAILAGKAVLCEKPITVNYQQCKQLVELAIQQQVFLMEAMWTYFIPATAVAKQWIEEGKIGKLKHIQADFCFPSDASVERLWKLELAGGALLDVGVYPIAFAHYFLREKPVHIQASAQLSASGVDEQNSIQLKYATCTAQLYSSIVHKGSNTAFLYGTKGYIKMPSFWRSSTIELYNNEDLLIETFADGRTTRGFHFEMQHATNCIREGLTESTVMRFQDSLQIQETMLEVRRQIGLQFPFEENLSHQ